MQPLFTNSTRRKIGWLYTGLTTIVLALGWYYPILGYTVALAMLGGMISAFIAGRWFCGNLCPRGGFLERAGNLYSPHKAVPEWFKSPTVRVGAVLFLFVMMGVNVARNPASWEHWGRVFWLMCVLTTAVGAIGAFFWHGRSWCQICPMGSGQNLIGGKISPLTLNALKCRQCLRCERSCPLKLSLIEKGTPPQLKPNRDCLKCGECIAACPVAALNFR